jgi:hypothetical protein
MRTLCSRGTSVSRPRHIAFAALATFAALAASASITTVEKFCPIVSTEQIEHFLHRTQQHSKSARVAHRNYYHQRHTHLLYTKKCFEDSSHSRLPVNKELSSPKVWCRESFD